MPVFSSKMTLFGKAGLYTINGMVSTLTPYEGKVGFDFLGFTIRQIPKSEKLSGKDSHGRSLGFKTLIKPSKEKIKQHTAETGKHIKKLRGAPQEALIKKLNPIIRGWANY